MTEQVDDYYNHGLVSQAFHAERNILIWQYVADEVSFLKTQPKHIQTLYQFIQQSSQANFILALAKIFDTPNKKFPTRCILSFLDLLNDPNLNAVKIIETTNTKKLLKEFNCPQTLLDAVEDPDLNLFPRLFAEHFQQKYSDPTIQEDLNTLKTMRDKAVAHNEAIGTLHFDFKISERLINFVSELISIFGMAYHSSIWKTENFSFLKKSAENDAYFIKTNISKLKEVENNA